MTPLVIVFAGEPQGKGRPRFNRATGNAYTPAATRKYEDALRYAAQQAMGDRAPLDEALIVTITAAMPVPASKSGKWQREALAGLHRPTIRPDWENIAKTLDALNKVVWRDDALIVDARVVKVYSDRPALTIEVRPLELLPLMGVGQLARQDQADAAAPLLGVAA